MRKMITKVSMLIILVYFSTFARTDLLEWVNCLT